MTDANDPATSLDLHGRAAFGAALKAAYEAAGFSRAGFVREIGSAYNTLWRYERGENLPGAETMHRIAATLGDSSFEKLLLLLPEKDQRRVRRAVEKLAADVDGHVLFQRYAWLVERLAEEYGHARGWMRRVADALDVHESYVSKIVRGQVTTVGIPVVDRAIRRLHLRRELFYDASFSLTKLSYADVVHGPMPHGAAPEDVIADFEPVDIEVRVMGDLARLDEAARRRVLAWARSRWPDEP